MVSPFSSRQSLQTRITLASLLIFVLGMWSLSFLASNVLRQDMETLLGQQQFSAASLMAASIDQGVEERMRALDKVATRLTPTLLNDATGLQAYLDDRETLTGLFSGGVYVIDAAGTVMADVSREANRVGLNYAKSDHIVEVLNGKPSISKPFYGKSLKAPVLVMTAPIRDDAGKVIGALGGVIDLGESGFLDKIVESSYGQSGGFLLIAPKHRLIITTKDKRRVMAPTLEPGINPVIDGFLNGREGSAKHVNPAGVEMLSSGKRIPAADWFIVLDLPTSEAFSPIRDMQRRMLWVTLILTLLAGCAMWWVLRRQLAPMLETVNSLAAMSEARQPPKALPIVRNDEIGHLVGGLNRLLEALGQREKALLEMEWKFRALFEIGPIGVSYQQMIYDDSGKPVDYRFIDANRSTQELLGRDPRGKNVIQFFPEIANSDFDWVGKFGRMMTTGEHLQFEKQLNTNGRWYEFVAYRYKPDHFVVVSLDITERKAAEEALRKSETSFRNFFENNASVLLLTEPATGEIVDANTAACDFYGYTRVQMLQMNISQINTLPSELIAEERQRAVRGDRKTFHFIHRLVSGELRDVEVHLTPIESGGRLLLFSIVYDTTERKRNQEQLQLAASVFSHAREAIMITRTDGMIIDVNASFSRITGYSRDEVVGGTPDILKSGRHEPDFYTGLAHDLKEKGHWYGEVWNRRKNGEVFATMQTISAVSDSHGNAGHYVSLISDITAFKEHEKQLEQIAHYDVLTTLPNRVLLADRMHQSMAQTLRRQQLLSVVYLDLDGFKTINDRHGHEMGDKLLISLAERMKQTLREGDTLARLGGDEFIAVLLDLGDSSASVPMLNRLLAAAAEPVRVDGLTLQVSASLGATFFPQTESVDADQLLRQADQAMYQAKLAGKNRFHIFDADLDRSVRGLHESLDRIRYGLINREFELYYQPKVNMRSGRVVGAEALIRWRHPERGLLSPDVFLPVIEDHPLAVDVGEWVIDTALGQMESWHQIGLDIPVSVNVSARQLQQINFVGRLRELLAAHPVLAPSALEIEVLETSALQDLNRVAGIIEECQAIGVRFALDDFGTGYSSLTYLKHLSVSQLKIDRSFVHDMLDDPDDLSILGGILSLATAFRREVIAEGVETIAHGTMLLQLGCELGQGYGIARPMPAADLPAWVSTWRPVSEWSRQSPLSRDDLPLLFAIVEHRAWIVAVDEFLQGERKQLPLVHHLCRFDLWLEKEGLAQYGSSEVFQEIVPLHRQAHALARHLCEADLDAPGLPVVREEFRATRERLLAYLGVLLQAMHID